MPATAERAAFASREYRYDTIEDATIRAAHPGARDTGDRPRASFFDDLAAAAAVNAERAGLLMTLPQRMAVVCAEALTDLATDTVTPTVRLTDPEQQLDADFLVSRLVLDLESETTSLELFRGEAI